MRPIGVDGLHGHDFMGVQKVIKIIGAIKYFVLFPHAGGYRRVGEGIDIGIRNGSVSGIYFSAEFSRVNPASEKKLPTLNTSACTVSFMTVTGS